MEAFHAPDPGPCPRGPPALAAIDAASWSSPTGPTRAPRALLVARALGLAATAACPPGPPWRVAGAQALREGPALLLTLWRLTRLRRP